MRISQIKKQAKEALKGNWKLTVLLTFIIILIESVPIAIVDSSISGGISQSLNRSDTPPGPSLFQIIYSLALIPFTTSVYWFYLKLVRKNKPEIPEVFSIYKDGSTSFKLIGLSLLQGLFIFLWSLLFIIPGIIKSLSYSQTLFLIKDHPEYSVNQAITESRKRMNGYKGKYFLLELSFIGWGILSVLSLGIGFLWLVPYINASLAEFYNELIASQDYSEFDNKNPLM